MWWLLEANGLSFDQAPITEGRDEQTAPDLTDAALGERFRDFLRLAYRTGFPSGSAIPSTIFFFENLAASSSVNSKTGRPSISSTRLR